METMDFKPSGGGRLAIKGPETWCKLALPLFLIKNSYTLTWLVKMVSSYSRVTLTMRC